MEKFIFYLYISGDSNISKLAISNVKKFCEEEICSNYEIFIIDILEESYLAEKSKILVTPTLIKECPGKMIRLIGDFSDNKKLMQALELENVYG